MKRITVYTATRAEYHLLENVIKGIDNDPDLELDLIVSGTHLSEKYGYTVKEIENSGVKIAKKIYVIDDEKENNVDEIIAKTLIETSDYFSKNHSDLLLVLGDRYELMGVVLAASNALIPIAHIHGGEKTEGAVDEAIRHAVTKFSYLHFPCCEEYRRRIIQLGENPERVFNVGALGVENIKKTELLLKEDLSKNLNFDLDRFCLVTFHPVTLEKESSLEQVKCLYEALDSFNDYTYIITGANADAGGSEINDFWKEVSESKPYKYKVVASLGMVRYLSAMKYCEMVIGNSSSGILETPAFKKATVNIGDRQKGRMRSANIIDCLPETNKIIEAMNIAVSKGFLDSISSMEQIYGDGNTSIKIINILKKTLLNGFDLKKSFFDIDIQEGKYE